MIETLFPTGWTHYLLGGALIGLAMGVIYLFTGVYGGASSVFTTTWSYVSSLMFFKQFRSVRLRKLVFSLGLICGGLLWMLWTDTAFHTTIQWWRLAVGGFLVGVGTRMGRGCTSGHGIGGLSAWSLPSFYAVLTFMAVAILTAQVVMIAGVHP